MVYVHILSCYCTTLISLPLFHQFLLYLACSYHLLSLNCFVFQPIQVRTVSITLNGLLEYDRSDDDELTVELSLFAEQFNEMLMRDFGFNIYQALVRER